MSFILAFDFGTNSIGTAVGNDVTCTVRPLKAIRARQGKADEKQLDDLIREWQPRLLVVGLPLMMDGSDQFITGLARHFAKELRRRYGLEVRLIDERLTTREAKQYIFEQGGFRALARDKGAVDSLSAALILQEYFDNYASPAG